MTRLNDIGLKYKTDKSSAHHDFLGLYEARLERFSNQPITLFELGVNTGGSLQMWAEFFPAATIVGADVADLSHMDFGPQIRFRQGDPSDSLFLHRLIEEFGRPDVIIDDATHRWDHQIGTLQFLYPILAPGGVYVVEDIDTSFGSYERRFAGYSDISTFDYLCRVARVVSAAGALGNEVPADLFAATASASIRSIEFARRTCLICKR
jgi:hypothetical protein